MHRRFTILLTLSVLTVAIPALHAQTDLQKKLKDTGIGAHWIYDDLAKGFEQAKATGKPMLALFR